MPLLQTFIFPVLPQKDSKTTQLCMKFNISSPFLKKKGNATRMVVGLGEDWESNSEVDHAVVTCELTPQTSRRGGGGLRFGKPGRKYRPETN